MRADITKMIKKKLVCQRFFENRVKKCHNNNNYCNYERFLRRYFIFGLCTQDLSSNDRAAHLPTASTCLLVASRKTAGFKEDRVSYAIIKINDRCRCILIENRYASDFHREILNLNSQLRSLFAY